jgi:hypothetical protein
VHRTRLTAGVGSEPRVFPRDSTGDPDEFFEPSPESAPRAAVVPFPLPVGVAWTPHHLSGQVHVVDGDGASLCERVAAADLVRGDERPWHEIALERRCPVCRFHLSDSESHG